MLPEPSSIDPSVDAQCQTLESSARRRLLRGGLAAGPVVLTIASRPVLGQTACLAPSAMVSMPTSGQQHAASMCSGLTPDQWAALATQWPSPYVGQGAAISAPATTTTTAAPAPAITTTTTTTYMPGTGHGVTIGSRATPNYTSTTTVQSQPTTASTSTTTSSASTTTSASTTCVTTPSAGTTSSYTPFANHGTTIGSRSIPTYVTTVPAPPSAPCTPRS